MHIRLALVAVALLPAGGAAPAFAADWTGFYAGFYAGVSARNAGGITFNGVAGIYDREDVQNHPDTYANPDGLPADLFGMLTDLSSQVLNINSAEAVGAHVDGTTSYGPGATLGNVVGYSFGNGLRIEQDNSHTNATTSLTVNNIGAWLLEGGYDGVVAGQFNWNIDTTLIDETGLNEDFGSVPIGTSATFILGDAWWDFDNDSQFTPYIGGGAGIAIVSHAFDLGIVSGHSTTIVPAVQFGGGVTIDLNETSFLDLGYRLKLADGGGSHTAGSGVEDPYFYAYDLSDTGLIVQHTIQLGMNMRLK